MATTKAHLIHPHVRGTAKGCQRPFVDFSVDLYSLPVPAPELIEDEVTEVTSIPWDEVVPLLDLIPPREADVVELIVLLGKNQKDVAEVLGLTQGGVSYALHRAVYRLHYLARKPKITREEVENHLRPILTPRQLAVIAEGWDNPSQSSIGARLDHGQGWVNHHHEYALRRVQAWLQSHPEAIEVATIYEHLAWVRDTRAWCSLVYVEGYAHRKPREKRE